MAVFLREVDTAIVPWVAIATIPRLHGNEGGTRGIGGGVLKEGPSAR